MNKTVTLIALGFASALLAGCSYLEKMFPDKERDYQYTSEIPMINLPPDLRRNKPKGDAYDLSSTPSSPASSDVSTGDAAAGQDDSAPPSETDSASSTTSPESDSAAAANPEVSSTEVTTAEDDEKDTVSSVEIVKYDDGESRLRLGAGHSKAWRVVNKALSRNTIEVTERKYEQSQIKIQYDPNEKPVKDEGFMDEISFIFNGIGVSDREYVLKLEEHGEQTDVIVLDEEFLPMLNDNDAVRLQKVIADTIKSDLAKKAKAEDSQ